MDIYKGETEIIPLVCVITNTKHKIGCAQLAKKKTECQDFGTTKNVISAFIFVILTFTAYKSGK